MAERRPLPQRNRGEGGERLLFVAHSESALGKVDHPSEIRARLHGGSVATQ